MTAAVTSCIAPGGVSGTVTEASSNHCTSREFAQPVIRVFHQMLDFIRRNFAPAQAVGFARQWLPFSRNRPIRAMSSRQAEIVENRTLDRLRAVLCLFPFQAILPGLLGIVLRQAERLQRVRE